MAIDEGFVKRLVEAYNKRSVDEFDKLLTEDVVMVRDEEKAHGREEFKAVLGRVLKAFPDIQYKIEDTIITGDKIVLRWQGKGTHKGEYLGVAATGRPVSYGGITLYEMKGDRIAKVFVAADLLSLLRRLKDQRAAAPQEAPRA
jgi:steroid delta-isomerase-like uncharacterized protein